jgi:hypothetical protein
MNGGDVRLLASSRNEEPRRRAMNPERDCGVDDSAKKISSCLLLLPFLAQPLADRRLPAPPSNHPSPPITPLCRPRCITSHVCGLVWSKPSVLLRWGVWDTGLVEDLVWGRRTYDEDGEEWRGVEVEGRRHAPGFGFGLCIL